MSDTLTEFIAENYPVHGSISGDLWRDYAVATTVLAGLAGWLDESVTSELPITAKEVIREIRKLTTAYHTRYYTR